MEGVAELGLGQQLVYGAGAVEVGDTAAGRVGVVVVHIEEEGRLPGVSGEDLSRYGSEDAAGGGAVRSVVGSWRLGRGVRRDPQVLVAEVAGAEGGGLWPRCLGRDLGGGGEIAVDESSRVDRQVDEGDALDGPGIAVRRELDGVGAPLVAEVVEAGLPADQVHNVLHDHMDCVGVKEVVARSIGGQAVSDGADVYGVGTA